MSAHCGICRTRHGDWNGSPTTEPSCLAVLDEAAEEEAAFWGESEPTK